MRARTALDASNWRTGGTIFLDEIGNVPMRQQSKLLRVLESEKSNAWDRRVPSGLMCALSPPRIPISRLPVRPGSFAKTLLFRLNTVEIHLPPLRERREDIAVLALHFLSHYASRYRRRSGGSIPQPCSP
jgi:DNA-binding NtrC family response regulator